MKHALLTAFLASMLTLALSPAHAAEDPCTVMTKESQDECIKQLDKDLEKLREFNKVYKALVDQLEEADRTLRKQIEKLLPKPKEKPSEHIPSSPNELRR